MTTRNDVSVEWNSSPRIAEVAAPAEDINMQDIVDTLRIEEESFRGMSEPKLLNASGKEDLGGGVKVGITVALQNLLLAFAARTTVAQTGTVTSTLPQTTTSTQRFEDTAADFVAAGIQRGSLLINFADKSVADVVEVESSTVLRTKVLQEGTLNDYTVADDYKIWNIVQCKADGGNLVAVDDLQASISSILPTAFTQIILTSSSSATLSEQEDIQFASYEGGVHIDLANITGNASQGTTYPTGTGRQPCDNWADTLSILTARGFDQIYVIGNATLPTTGGLTFDGIRFVGQSANRTTLTVPAAADAPGCEYLDCFLTGTLDGNSIVERSVVGDLDVFSGFLFQCGVASTITLGNAAQASLLDCFSLVPGGGTPIIDMGGSGQSLVVRNWNGGIRLENKTGADAISIDMNSGQVQVADSCATATSPIYLRGTAKWTNRDTYIGTNVEDELVDGKEMVVLRKIMRNKMVTDPNTGIMTVYDDDGVTVLLSCNIYEDTSLAQAYRGRGMEVRERLE